MTGPDSITIRYSVPVNAAGSAYGALVVDGTARTYAAGPPAGDGTAVHTLAFTGGAPVPADAAGTLTMNQTAITDPDGRALGSLTADLRTLTDGQPPRMASAFIALGNGTTEVAFDEPVSGTTAPAEWTVAGILASSIAGHGSGTASLSGATGITLLHDEPVRAQVPNPAVSYSGAGLADAASNVLAPDGDDTATDGSVDATYRLTSIKVGVLVPLTGELAYFGNETLAGIRKGVADVNDGPLAPTGRYITLHVNDTTSNSTVALDALRQMHTRDGIDLVLGLPTSSGLENVMDYAGASQILLFSCCSAASDLAVQDDGVFRLGPTTDDHGPVIAEHARDAGIDTIIPVYRNDTWGRQLHGSLAGGFEALAGVVVDGIPYYENPDTRDIPGTVDRLKAAVAAARGSAASGDIAVVLIGFAEGADIMERAAAEDPNAKLDTIRWFGALTDDGITSNDAARGFAASVGYTVPRYAPDRNHENFDAVLANITAALGLEAADPASPTTYPSTYAFSAYDTARILGGSIVAASGSAGYADVKAALPAAARAYPGLVGNTTLDAAGDRADSAYELWGIGGDDGLGGGEWILTDTALSGTVRLGVLGPFSGDLASLGAENAASMDKSVFDFNAYLESTGADWRLSLDRRDTRTDSAEALAQLKNLDAAGIDLVLGPATSSNLKGVIGYAVENETLLFSCCSTAPGLDTPDDGVFRLGYVDPPTESPVASLVHQAGISHIVPVYRDDDWGRSIDTATAAVFGSMGGTYTDSISYNPDGALRDDADTVRRISEAVSEQVAAHGAQNVGLVVFAFEEIADIMDAAAAAAAADPDSGLDTVRWFGTDIVPGITRSGTVSFAEGVDYTVIQLAPDRSHAKHNEFNGYLIDALSYPDASYVSPSAYAAYDTVQIMGMAIKAAGTVRYADINTALPAAARAYPGLVGNTTLNAAGDLAASTYEWQQIRDGAWVLLADQMPPLLVGASLDLTAGDNGRLTLTFNEPVTVPGTTFAGDITVTGTGSSPPAPVTLSVGTGDLTPVAPGAAGGATLALDISGAKRIELNAAGMSPANITLPTRLVSDTSSGNAYDAALDVPSRALAPLVQDPSPPALSAATVRLAPDDNSIIANSNNVTARLVLTFNEAVTAPQMPPPSEGNITVQGSTPGVTVRLSAGDIHPAASGSDGDKTFILHISDPGRVALNAAEYADPSSTNITLPADLVSNGFAGYGALATLQDHPLNVTGRDTAAPHFVHAFVVDNGSVAVVYDEPVRSDPAHYTGMTVNGAPATDPAVNATAATPFGNSILVLWNSSTGVDTEPGVSFDISGDVADIFENGLENHGSRSTPTASGQIRLADIMTEDDGTHRTDRVDIPITANTTIDRIDAGSITPVIRLVQTSGGTGVFPKHDLTVSTDNATVVFPPAVNVIGLSKSGFITVAVSAKVPSDEFRAANPGLDLDDAIIIEFGDPNLDLDFTEPIKTVIPDLGNVAFSIDSAGKTLRILDCGDYSPPNRDNHTRAAHDIGGLTTTTGDDPRACRAQGTDTVWTMHFSAIGGPGVPPTDPETTKDSKTRVIPTAPAAPSTGGRSSGGGGGGGWRRWRRRRWRRRHAVTGPRHIHTVGIMGLHGRLRQRRGRTGL